MLQIRYHQDLKGRDTVLLAGTQNDIDLLRSFFLQWNGEEYDLVEFLQARERPRLFAVAALRVLRDTDRQSFIWRQGTGECTISQLCQDRIVSLLGGLLDARGGAHQYLEPDDALTQLMVSKDEEYPFPI